MSTNANENTSAVAITADDSLNQVVARYPNALPVLQRFGLDTCCGGSLPLRVAAEHHALDLEAVLAALRAIPQEQAR